MGISRRAFLAGAGAAALQAVANPTGALGSVPPRQRGLGLLSGQPRQNELIEFALVAVHPAAGTNPFRDFEFPVVFVGPDGRRLQTSAFWHESGMWRVRLLAEIPGQWFGVVDKTTMPIFVEPTDTPGVVRRRGRQLKYADGAPYIALGTNTSWARSLDRRG